MAITVPNVVKAVGSGVTTVTTSGVTTTTGSTFVAWSTADDAVTINKPTDSKSNDYGTAKVTVSTGGGSSKQTVYVKENGAGGSSHTLTFTYGASTYPTAYFIECAGAATASYDSGSLTSGASGAGSPFNRNSGGQAQANNAILTFCATDASGTLTYTNSGYTVTQEQDGNNYWTGAIGRQIVSQTSAVTSSWSVSATNGGTVTFAIKEATGGGSVSGTVSWTEANDTASLAGSATVSGGPSWTEANDTAALAGSVRVSGTASWTEANDTAALAGSATVSGAASWTEANDSASLAGSLTVSGSISWTEVDDAAALTGSVGDSVSGALSWTEADDTSALSGALSVSGAGSWTESSDTASLTGQVTQPASGTVAWVEADDLWSVIGTNDSGLQLLGGGPGGPRKRRKGGTESYLERLLGRPLDEIEEPEEEIQVIEQAAEVAAQAPQPPDVDEVADSLREYGIALKDAYVQIFLELERQKRQQREEEEVMAVIAMVL